MRLDYRGFAVLWSLGFFGCSAFAAAPRASKPLAESELAARIDHHISARLKDAGMSPAPVADDAEFIRRVYLDLAGRIPNIIEVRDFLDDDRSDKRRLTIDVLLQGKKTGENRTTYTDHFARVWRDWLLSGSSNARVQQIRNEMERWLREQLKDNVRYDHFVRTILESPDNGGPPGAFLFNAARESKPEEIATATARLFLGYQLDCAQCHDDRSGGSWSREQFWQFAAFFTPDSRIAIPGTKSTVNARFLDGAAPVSGRTGRRQLAEWLTRADNPAFARATVNRAWSYFFAVGLVDPIDAGGAHNPPSHPELMDELATQFILHRYDLKYLLRAIVLSETYQRTSKQSHAGQDDARLFARMPVRGLTTTQLVASLMEVANRRTDPAVFLDRLEDLRGDRPLEQLASRFAAREQGAEANVTILQALHLMNGPFLAGITTPGENPTLEIIADTTRGDTARRVETLYLVALARKPSAKELKAVVAYVDRGGPTGDSRKAMADVLWAMLNSAEFLYNH